MSAKYLHCVSRANFFCRFHYSFHQLAENNKKLLDDLNIKKVIVLGHLMGGMLATRFTLMFPETVEKLILENPIGLEDYRTFVPFESLEKLEQTERTPTYESYKNYQKSYYPEFKPEYEQYVAAQAADLRLKNFPQIAFVNALTYQMIYEQPVYYELENIKVPTLLIIGQTTAQLSEKQKFRRKLSANTDNFPNSGAPPNRKLKMRRLLN